MLERDGCQVCSSRSLSWLCVFFLRGYNFGFRVGNEFGTRMVRCQADDADVAAKSGWSFRSIRDGNTLRMMIFGMVAAAPPFGVPSGTI